MKIEPVEIEIDDEKLFTDIALVVDQERFKKLVNEAREKLDIKRVLNEEEYLEFKDKHLHFKKGKILNQLEENIRTTQRLPITFKGIIRKSILCGKIVTDDYKLAYLELRKGEYDEETDFLDLTPVIVFSPHARKEDVYEAWQEYNDNIGNYKAVASYGYIPKEVHTEKGKGAIKDHRKWYLLYEQGYSVSAICKKLNSDEKVWYKDSTVRKGIDNYIELLRKSRVS